MTKKLIVNADDWGMSPRFNEGILRGMIAGTITSTTVLVGRPFVEHEKETLLECDVSVGLHLELPKDKSIEEQAEMVAAELERQCSLFKQFFGRPPTHLDSHYNLHLKPEIFPKVVEFAKTNGVAVRMRYSFDRDQLRAQGIKTTDNFLNSLGKNDFERIELVKHAVDGTNEIMTHPGFFDPECKSSVNKEREEELSFLTSEDFKRVLAEENIALIDWREV